MTNKDLSKLENTTKEELAKQEENLKPNINICTQKTYEFHLNEISVLYPELYYEFLTDKLTLNELLLKSYKKLKVKKDINQSLYAFLKHLVDNKYIS